jgi:vancomycin resistance protein VanW
MKLIIGVTILNIFLILIVASITFTSAFSAAPVATSKPATVVMPKPVIVAPKLIATVSKPVTVALVKPVLISKYTTSFRGSSAGRVSNIKLAAKLINWKIIKPGQTFSYLSAVGNPNDPRKGWKKATVLVGGKHATGYGGGICQVSSTLYNAVLLGRFTVVERHAHSLSVGYVPRGRDATVTRSGGLDFKFKNNSKNSIRIETVIVGTTVTVKIFKI